ncbi:hypothetical protein JW877_10135 [bacterium]|nr:hypothetical protein [bacterium]
MGLQVGSAIRADDSDFERYFLHINDHPQHQSVSWGEELQGLAHYGDYWFISQKLALWKIHISFNLDRSTSGVLADTVLSIGIEEIWALDSLHMDHFGDLDCYEYGGHSFLFVPIEDEYRFWAIIAVFRTEDLSFVDYAEVSLGHREDAPWCAVYPTPPDPSGRIYLYSSSFNGVGLIYVYEINWEELINHGILFMELHHRFCLSDEDGDSLFFDHIQGGAFSPSGRYIYLVNGNADDDCDCGIKVFETATGMLVRESSNDPNEPFRFEYNPGYCTYEEPEGLDIWDLDEDPRAPFVYGQLHVILLDNDFVWCGDEEGDELFIKHLTNTIYVDQSWSGDEEGTPIKPLNTVSEANYLAWNGSKIKIQAGSYDERIIFSKRLFLYSVGGSAVIK